MRFSPNTSTKIRIPTLDHALPVSIPRWRVTAFEWPVTGTLTQPFVARGVDHRGGETMLCVKPLALRSDAEAFAAGAELLGGVIGAMLGVPVADVGLAWVGPRFLASVGPVLRDVRPGWAAATRWIGGAFSAGVMGGHALVVNPDTVAGVTVLDTLIGNHDRAGNILLEPVDAATRAFALRYIDHAWGLGGYARESLLPDGATEDELLCYAPEDETIRSLVLRQESFLPYLLAAEALPFDALRALAADLPALGWGVGDAYADGIVTHLQAAARHIRPVVMRSLSHFPRCV